MAKRIKGYTRADGTKVKGHNRVEKKKAGRKVRKRSREYKTALEKSKTSKSGHKSWRERQKEKRPGLWSNVHAKRHREGK